MLLEHNGPFVFRQDLSASVGVHLTPRLNSANRGRAQRGGHHLHATAGTIFHKSSTSLHLWFDAKHLLTSTPCGISAKQLERELGVTSKTASRMAHLIGTKLMEQDGDRIPVGS